ncbi:alpha/beta hydrolase, partial [Streptomyces sp. NRRL B-24572]|uniref:alpha/beta hydrolase n=1 Tax=Streptomyces sp. NRRL B-24572 TaxID=1962156 RepID=UPI001C4FC524
MPSHSDRTGSPQGLLPLVYGSHPDQVADLHLPARPASGRLPLVLFFHGGFWRAAHDRRHTAAFADALARDCDCAVVNVEYRRVGAGGGWPTTLIDTARAVDLLPELASRAAPGRIDTGRVVYAGHSAGGHLALWAAARHRLPEGAPAAPTRLPRSAASLPSRPPPTSPTPTGSAAAGVPSPTSSAAAPAKSPRGTPPPTPPYSAPRRAVPSSSTAPTTKPCPSTWPAPTPVPPAPRSPRSPTAATSTSSTRTRPHGRTSPRPWAMSGH